MENHQIFIVWLKFGVENIFPCVNNYAIVQRTSYAYQNPYCWNIFSIFIDLVYYYPQLVRKFCEALQYGNSKSIKYVNTTIVDYIHICLICFGVRVICSPSWRQVLAITRVKTNILYFILDAKKVVLTLLSGRAKVPPNLVLN